MEYVKLGEIIEQIRGVSYKPVDVCNKNNGIPILTASNIQDDKIILDELIYINSDKIKPAQFLQKNDILICASSGSKSLVGKAGVFNNDIKCAFGAFCKVVRLKDKENVVQDYLNCFFRSNIYRTQISEMSQGANINNIKTENIDALKIPLPPFAEQQKIAAHLDKINEAINNKKKQLALFDELVKSKFVEMFGDLETNPKKWNIVNFDYAAKIDGVMTTDYEKYADYPHIGIDSIMKNTGELVGYRTVKEDNVISGKYLFTPEHIIYSKIRPNLNKVALPDFSGLCSADSYPILVNSENCNRYYFAYVLRSDFFLSYILAFSSRAGMPKVNREQIRGFEFPLPPLPLQNQFADFVQKCNRAKSTVKQEITCLKEVFDAKMYEYFGGESL